MVLIAMRMVRRKQNQYSVLLFALLFGFVGISTLVTGTASRFGMQIHGRQAVVFGTCCLIASIVAGISAFYKAD
jgi:tellurite resistance protein TehA-like permease